MYRLFGQMVPIRETFAQLVRNQFLPFLLFVAHFSRMGEMCMLFHNYIQLWIHIMANDLPFFLWYSSPLNESDILIAVSKLQELSLNG